MITNTLSSPYNRTNQSADFSITLRPGTYCRKLMIPVTVILNSGATPNLTMGLFDGADAGFVAPLAPQINFSNTDGDILVLEFPPPAVILRIDFGPVAQNWDIKYRLNISTDN